MVSLQATQMRPPRPTQSSRRQLGQARVPLAVHEGRVAGRGTDTTKDKKYDGNWSKRKEQAAVVGNNHAFKDTPSSFLIDAAKTIF
jgi:hypothetical protein